MELNILSTGKEYISAVSAAKKTGYSSDYIGQLCRSGKVAGKLVDRVWYVDLEGLENHKKNRQLGKPKKINETETFEKELESLPEPVLQKDLRDSNLSYETEDFPLLPQLNKNIVLIKPVSDFVIAKQASALTLGFLLVFGTLFATLEKISPKTALEIGEQITAFKNTSTQTISDALVSGSFSEGATASVFSAISSSMEFVADSFVYLRNLALGGFSDQETDTNVPTTRTTFTQAIPTSPQGVAVQAVSKPSSTISSSGPSLKSELEAYVRAKIAELTNPTIINSPVFNFNTTALREQILLADTRPTVTRQADADSNRLSLAAFNIINDGTLYRTRLIDPNISGSNITGLSSVFINATSTNASSTNFFADNAVFNTGVGGDLTLTNLLFTSATGTSATSTNLFAGTASSTNLFSTNFNLGTGLIGLLNFTDAIGINSTTTNSTSTNLFAENAIFNNLTGSNIDLSNLLFTSATGTSATTTNFFSTIGTFDELYVNDYQQNDGTFAIISTVATGDIFSVSDASITNGTLIHQTLTANAGNGQVSRGQIIDLVDSTTAGGGYSALEINVTGAGVGSGDKTLLSLNPGGNNAVVFDASGSLRPTTDSSSNTNSIGSASYYWKNGYFDTLTANNLSGTVVTGSTSNDTWTIGSTEAGDDLKSVIFQRNSGSGNATFSWNSGANDLRFLSVNYPFNATYTVDDSSISTTANLYSGALTNNTTSGTQRLLSISNTGTGTTEHGIYLNNTGTGTTAFEIAGTWTNGIVTNNNSINAGSGNITTTGLGTLGNLLLTGSSTLQNLTFVNATGTSATSTNLFAGTASSTNLFSTNFNLGTGFIGFLTATDSITTNSTTTNATSTNLFAGTASSTNLFSTNFNFADGVVGTLVSGNSTSTNFFSTTASSTNLFSTNFNLGTGSIGSLTTSSITNSSLTSGRIPFATTGGLLTDTSALTWDNTLSILTATNSIFTNSTSTNATSTNLYFSNNLSGPGNFFVTSSGDVGIGTTNPPHRLTVTGGPNSSQLWIGTDATYGYLMGRNTGTGDLDIRGSQSLYTGYNFMDPSGNSRFYVAADSVNNNTGFVGIGTTLPTSKIHAIQFGNTTDNHLTLDLFASTQSRSSGLLFRRSSQHVNATTLNVTQDGDTLGSFEFQGVNSLSNAYANSSAIKVTQDGSAGSTYVPAKISFFTSDGTNNIAERLTIKPSGNVGIGTSNPATTLDVLGTASSTNLFTTNSTSTNATSTNFFATTASSTNLFSSVASIGGRALNVISSGNVGIGTTNPGKRLEVYAGVGNSSTHNGLRITRSDLASIYMDLYPRNTYAENGVAIDASGFESIFMSSTDGDVIIGGAPTGPTGATGSKLTVNGSLNIGYVPSTVAPIDGLLVEGNVGIGTTNPGSKLEVYGSTVEQRIVDSSATGNPKLSLYQTTSERAYFAYENGVGTVLDSDSSVYLRPNNTASLRMSSSGGLSVGTGYVSTGASDGQIIASGSVGIGTTNPGTNKLEVVGPVAVSGASAGYRMYNQTTNALSSEWFSPTAGETRLYNHASSVTQLTINSSGNVGIGTTNPQWPLNVYRSNSSTNPLALLEQASTGDASLSWYLTGGQQFSMGIDNSDSDKFKISGSGTLGTSDYMTFTTSGNIGMGTTNPAALLTVSNTTENGAAVRVQRTNALSSTYTELGTVGGAGRLESFNGNLTIGADAGNSDASSIIQFKVDNTEMMRINSSGNVGIGTTNPVAKFVVEGLPTTESPVTNPATASTYNTLSFSNSSITDPVFGSGVTRLANSSTYTMVDPTAAWASGNGIFNISSGISTAVGDDQDGGTMYGIYNNVAHWGTGALSSIQAVNNTARNESSGNITAIYGEIAGAANAGSGSVTTMRSFSGTLANTSTGIVANASGVFQNINNSGTGTITTPISADIRITNSGGGTLTTPSVIQARYTQSNVASVVTNDLKFLDVLSLTNTGTISGTTYGLYIGDITAGIQTGGAYSVYASDAGSLNYFAGNVGIGTTNPTVAKLHVANSNAAAAVVGATSYATGSTYGGLFSAGGAATTNVGVYAGSTGGTTNYGIQIGSNTPSAGANNWALYSASQAKSYFEGSVGIGTTNPVNKLHVYTAESSSNVLRIENNNASPFGPYIYFSGASPDNNSNYFMRFDDTTGVRMYIYSDGDIVNHDNSYGAISDVRLKENISLAGNYLDLLNQVQIKKYSFISDHQSEADQIGVIAQELELIFPELVNTGTDGYKTVAYSQFTPLIIRSIQELSAKVELLENASSTSGDSNFNLASIFDGLWQMIVSKMATAANSIGDFFANRVRTKELCVSDDNGETCITKAALDSLLANAGLGGSTGGNEPQNNGGDGEVIDGGNEEGGEVIEEGGEEEVVEETPEEEVVEENNSESSEQGGEEVGTEETPSEEAGA